ncbi:MAG: HEAT repeat domain-containing protein [Gemmatimonadales bacterium]
MLEQPDATQQAAIAPVEEMLHLFSRGLKAKRLYMDNNPVYQQAMKDLQSSFEAIWNDRESLTLELSETELICDEKPVHKDPTKAESIAWILHKDGIRSITLDRGVEETELVLFLAVINKARSLPPESEDDLLTLLWQQNFQLVRYDFVEIGLGDVESIELGDTKLSATPQQIATELAQESTAQQQSTAAEGSAVGSAVVAPVREEPELRPYFLEEEEIEYLRAEVQREYSQDLRRNTLSMVLDILELQPKPDTREEVIAIVENFIPYLMEERDIKAINYALGEIKIVLRRVTDLEPEHVKLLEEIPRRVSQGDALRDLLKGIATSENAPPRGEWEQFLNHLTPDAVGPILASLPDLGETEFAGALRELVNRFLQRSPDEFSRVLESDDLDILERSVKLAGELQMTQAVPNLAMRLNHEVAAIRLAVAEALGQIESPGALLELRKALDDSDSDVRTAAVKAFARTKNLGALDKITEAITSKSLRQANLAEKTAFFEAFGILAGEDGIAELKPLLLGGGFLGKKAADLETRACVTVALGKIGGPRARALLEKAVRKDKHPLVKNAAQNVLKEMS